jgi:hypothetical protein
VQLTLFDDIDILPRDPKMSRSGTFIDNMALPVHRWFRYSAGFSAQWVEHVLSDWGFGSNHIILDPFAGSGTVSVTCDSLGIDSIGVEAHPMVARICRAKLLWATPIKPFTDFARQVLQNSRSQKSDIQDYPDLIHRSYDNATLTLLDQLKLSWLSLRNDDPESELVWLALTAILRSTSKAGTAQWQYILPNKTKKKILQPLLAFEQQIENMGMDMRHIQRRAVQSRAQTISGDARTLSGTITKPVDGVITSPPYANNYDYADALRFEMTFWGDVKCWGDIHSSVRRHLLVSSSQHASSERLKAEELLKSERISAIREELTSVVQSLAETREYHGGKKHYHTMIAAYCRDIGESLHQLRKVCRPGAKMCWVIGDSAPYGVYCPIDEWIAQMALSVGFHSYRFEKLRDRNIKWKNRKHRVPLKEGLLWIEG